jgi:hypothetical protein
VLLVGNIPWRQIALKPSGVMRLLNRLRHGFIRTRASQQLERWPASEKRVAIPEMQQRSVQPKEKCIDEYAFF